MMSDAVADVSTDRVPRAAPDDTALELGHHSIVSRAGEPSLLDATAAWGEGKSGGK
jgi:hypothetical protein